MEENIRVMSRADRYQQARQITSFDAIISAMGTRL